MHRELTGRELELLHMIRPTTFRDIVEAVREDFDNNRFKARRLIKNLRNIDPSGDHIITNKNC